MRVHKKVWREYFEDVVSGRKRFDLRLADFHIGEGDTLVMDEWDNEKSQYTGRTMEVVVDYVFKTRDLPFWNKEEIADYGFQIIQFVRKGDLGDGLDPTRKTD